MKKINKAAVLMPIFALIMFFMISANAQTVATDENGNQWKYTLSNNEATEVKPVNPYMGETITIPSELDSYPVVSLSENSMSYNAQVKNIILPNTLRIIGDMSFVNCENLTSITIPESVTYIGAHAFGNCYELKTFNFNATNCQSAGLVEQDGAYGFAQIFQGCGNLTTVNIGDNVTKIPAGTFIGIPISEITIPASVQNIEMAAFYGCANLTNVNYMATNATTSMQAMYGIFTETGDLALSITDNVTSIPDYLFLSTTIKNVNIPSSVKSIGNYAFYSANIENLTLNEGLETINNYAFAENHSIKTLSIPASVKLIGDGAFKEASQVGDGALESVNFGNNLTAEIVGNVNFVAKNDGIPAKIIAHKQSTAKKYADDTNAEFDALCQHVKNDEKSVAPKCLEDGLLVEICPICSDEISSKEDKLGHDFSKDFIVDKEPTCTEKGSKSRHCSRCDVISEETEIPELKHDYKITVVEPTCLKDGYTEHTCKRGDDTFKDNKKKALGHDYKSTVKKEATCTEKGELEKVCSRCQDTIKEEIPLKDHIKGEKDYKRVKGYWAIHCTKCDKELEKGLITYKITYDLDGGKVSDENKGEYTIETETFKLNNPTRDGYTFEGWKGDNGTSTSYEIKKGTTGDLKITATWKKKDEVVTVEKENDNKKEEVVTIAQAPEAKQNTVKIVQTGDESNALLYILIIVSVLGCAGVYFKKNK